MIFAKAFALIAPLVKELKSYGKGFFDYNKYALLVAACCATRITAGYKRKD